MSDLPTLRAQLDALLPARFAGEKRVQFNDREVEYRTDSELRQAINDLERRIAALQGTSPALSIVIRDRDW